MFKKNFYARLSFYKQGAIKMQRRHKYLAILSLLLFFIAQGYLFAEEEQESGSSPVTTKRFRFDPTAEETLPDRSSVDKWANSKLKSKLGLGKNDSIMLLENQKKLSFGSVYKIQQKHQGIPVEQLEGSIILTKDGKPIKANSRSTQIVYMGEIRPSINVEQALLAANYVPGSKYIAKIAFWMPSNNSPTLSYKLVGTFKVKTQEMDQIVFVNAHTGKVLHRSSRQLS